MVRCFPHRRSSRQSWLGHAAKGCPCSLEFLSGTQSPSEDYFLYVADVLAYSDLFYRVVSCGHSLAWNGVKRHYGNRATELRLTAFFYLSPETWLSVFKCFSMATALTLLGTICEPLTCQYLRMKAFPSWARPTSVSVSWQVIRVWMFAEPAMQFWKPIL